MVLIVFEGVGGFDRVAFGRCPSYFANEGLNIAFPFVPFCLSIIKMLQYLWLGF